MSCSIDKNQIDKELKLFPKGNFRKGMMDINQSITESLYSDINQSSEKVIGNVNSFMTSMIYRLLELRDDKTLLSDFPNLTKEEIDEYLEYYENNENKLYIPEILNDLSRSIEISSDIEESNKIEELFKSNLEKVKTENITIETSNENTVSNKNGKKLLNLNAKVLDKDTFALLSISDIVYNIEDMNEDLFDINDLYRIKNKSKINNTSLDNGNFIDKFIKTYLKEDAFVEEFSRLSLLSNSLLKRLYEGKDYESFVNNIHPSIMKLKMSLSKDFYILDGDNLPLLDKNIRITGVPDIVLVNKNTKKVSLLDIKSTFTNSDLNEEKLKKYKLQLSLYNKMLGNQLPSDYTMSDINYIYFVSNTPDDLVISSEVIPVVQMNLEKELDTIAKTYKKIDKDIIGRYKDTKIIPTLFSTINIFEELKKKAENNDSVC